MVVAKQIKAQQVMSSDLESSLVFAATAPCCYCSMLLTSPPVVSLSAVLKLSTWIHAASPLLRSGPLRSPEELQEPYPDRAIKASDKYRSKSKTAHSAEVKPVKLLYFYVFCSTMGTLYAAQKGQTAPFTNQLSLEGNLLVDDIEVKSAHGEVSFLCKL
ncbi:hypothetical protein AMECASPLE_029243 [Ameca splendens]|uniref:Uncharacterized protein n=1 Tax=Ameca splendens TaxID=208324 RepID=A0ABV0ZEI1_9TELE